MKLAKPDENYQSQQIFLLTKNMNFTNKTSDFIPTPEILVVFLQGPICIIGFVLNIINFSVFVRRKYFAAPYVLLSALSLADAVTLLLYSTETMAKCQHLSFCRQPYIQLCTYVFAIYVKVPLSNMTETISSIITVALATERYLAMRHYNFRKIYFTVKNTRLFVLSISVFSTLFNTPFFFITSIRIDFENDTSTKEQVPVVYSNYTSMMDSPFYSAHSWTRAIAIQMLPLVYLCICNSLLLALICHHNKRLEYIRSSNSTSPDYRSSAHIICDSPLSSLNNQSSIRERKQIAQNKLTVLLSTIIFLYLMGQIPSALAYVQIYRRFGSCGEYEYIHECPNYDLYRTITLIMMLSCYTMNFFVYFFLNSHFRKSLGDCFYKMFPSTLSSSLRADKAACCYNTPLMKDRNNSLVVQSTPSNHASNLTIPNYNANMNSLTKCPSNKAIILPPIVEQSREEISSNWLETFEIESTSIPSNIIFDMADMIKMTVIKTCPVIVPLAITESVSFESINNV